MGLSQVLAKYDVVLVDQYGVLHNGTQPMIGAVDCFNRMIEAGKRVCSCLTLPIDPPGYRPSLSQRRTWTRFSSLDVEIVGLDKAQFLVVEGVQQRRFERKLPLLCPNSDAVGVVENDRFVYMGGGIAKLYEEKGGEVVYFGKPTKEHFEVCLQLANVTDKSKVVHIGDSLPPRHPRGDKCRSGQYPHRGRCPRQQLEVTLGVMLRGSPH
ncbi:HAD-like domain [Phytophthora cactorum]|nr:HAD-like domain [Phytophthora cactorum]